MSVEVHRAAHDVDIRKTVHGDSNVYDINGGKPIFSMFLLFFSGLFFPCFLFPLWSCRPWPSGPGWFSGPVVFRSAVLWSLGPQVPGLRRDSHVLNDPI